MNCAVYVGFQRSQRLFLVRVNGESLGFLGVQVFDSQVLEPVASLPMGGFETRYQPLMPKRPNSFRIVLSERRNNFPPKWQFERAPISLRMRVKNKLHYFELHGLVVAMLFRG